MSTLATRRGRTSHRALPRRGYRVLGRNGYVGIVERVCTNFQPPVLAVRAGLFVPRTLLIPLAAVARVIPRERRVLLR